MNFNDAATHSATELHLLRERAESKFLFDKSVEWMNRMKFRADIKRGYTRNKDGVVAQYVNYDWSDEYVMHPYLVFHDFFRGHLLNKYFRLCRGLDAT